MTILETIKAAYAKIRARSRWTQGPFAVDDEGVCVEPVSDRACRWCASGAIRAVTKMRYPEWTSALDALDHTAHEFNYDSLIAANETGRPDRAHKRIVKIYRETIKRLSKP